MDNSVEKCSNVDICPETGEEDQKVAIMQVQQAERSGVADASETSTSTAVERVKYGVRGQIGSREGHSRSWSCV